MAPGNLGAVCQLDPNIPTNQEEFKELAVTDSGGVEKMRKERWRYQ